MSKFCDVLQTFVRELIKFCKIEFPQGAAVDDLIEVKSLKLVLGSCARAYPLLNS